MPEVKTIDSEIEQVSDSANESANKPATQPIKEQKQENLNSVPNKFIRYVFALKKTQILLGVLSTISLASALTIAFSNIAFLEVARKAMMEFLHGGEATPLGVALVVIPSILVFSTLLGLLVDGAFLYKRSNFKKLSATTDIDLSKVSANLERLLDRAQFNANVVSRTDRSLNEKLIANNLRNFISAAISAQIDEFRIKDSKSAEDCSYTPSCGYGYVDISEEISKIHDIVTTGTTNKSYAQVLKSVKFVSKSINQNINSAKSAYFFFNGSTNLNLAQNTFNNHAKYLTELLSKEKSAKEALTQEGTATASLGCFTGLLSSCTKGSKTPEEAGEQKEAKSSWSLRAKLSSAGKSISAWWNRNSKAAESEPKMPSSPPQSPSSAQVSSAAPESKDVAGSSAGESKTPSSLPQSLSNAQASQAAPGSKGVAGTPVIA